MRRHLLVMPPRDRIGRAFRAALEHSAFSCRILPGTWLSLPLVSLSRRGRRSRRQGRSRWTRWQDPSSPIRRCRFLMVDIDTASQCPGRDYIPRLFQDDYVRRKMVSSRRFCAGNERFAHDRVRWPSSHRGLTASCPLRRRFPVLRCKSGVCYTAGANSPFEAYIHVR